MAEAQLELWGFTLFADDFRQEVGSKSSLMGIYNSDIVFREGPPFRIPKLVMLVMAYMPADAEPEPLEIRVYVPGEPSEKPTIQININGAGAPASSNADLDEDMQLISHVRLPLVLEASEIKAEGFLKVRILKGGKTYNFGSLKVRKMTAIERENLGLPPEVSPPSGTSEPM